MVGKTLGHYRILEKIGAGGMGEVYRAHDDHLDRDVAIKVLPAGTLADESARKRFRKEALALSKLNHPNIATVFDFDTQDGVDFLVMELVVGEGLSEKLPGRPLPEKDVLRIGAQLAEGLAAAHEQNVIHRDLKPGNLRLTPDGRLKILDFGLAKLIQPFSLSAPTASVTETGAVAGTLPYMAPEQVRGEKADARSDIYAAGCVLYELATGQRPFPERQGPQLIDAILNRAPALPRELQPKLSAELERITLKSLEKEPENRYQLAKELVVDLRRLATPTAGVPPRRQPRGFGARGFRRAAVGLGVAVALVAVVVVGLNVGGVRDRLFGGAAGAPQIDSIAVLPLDNLSGDAEQEYFVEGMHEALITELSKISTLKVISRTSAMRYKKTDKLMPQIARELGVNGLIEGSVAREGNQVRITVQLIHGPSDKHLWAESYQRELRGILALQSEVARDIAQEIRVQLTPQEQVRLASARPANPEAYEAYLKGQYYINQFANEQREEPLRKSIEYYEQAIRLDPGFAPAYADLSTAYFLLAGDFGVRELRPKAKAAALKALELDDNLGPAHNRLGMIKLRYEWDWVGAERELKRAIELDPNYPWAHMWYAVYLQLAENYEQALAEYKRAEELDPLVLAHKANIGGFYICARQYDQAIEQYRKTLALSPNAAFLHDQLGGAYVGKGMYKEAFDEFQKALELSGGDPRYQTSLAWAYAMAGKRAEALKILDEFKEPSKRKFLTPFGRALIYAALGEKEHAFIWLEKAYEERNTGLPFIKCDPAFDNLRGDPRFKDLRRRMNLPVN